MLRAADMGLPLPLSHQEAEPSLISRSFIGAPLLSPPPGSDQGAGLDAGFVWCEVEFWLANCDCVSPRVTSHARLVLLCEHAPCWRSGCVTEGTVPPRFYSRSLEEGQTLFSKDAVHTARDWFSIYVPIIS